MSDDDLLVFVDDDPPGGSGPSRTWKVAVIDDDTAVHDGTRFALYDYRLHDHGIELLSAYSAAEGKKLLAAHPDIAVILLDVVMESENAGLRLVEYIRKELKNDLVRIILRTGQPGQAPERRVIVDYDINDYKPKTELTSDKLFTALTAALRSYQQLAKMEETRRGLGIIVDAAATLHDLKSMQRLAEGVLTQIASLLRADCDGILLLRDDPDDRGFRILAGSGIYERYAQGGDAPLDEEISGLVQDAFTSHSHRFRTTQTALYVHTASGRELVVAIESNRPLTETDRELVELFCGKLPFAFDNVLLYEDIRRANESLEQRVADRTAELTAANERLAFQRETLRRANAFKNVMLGMVAHELKNPLGVILGRAEIIHELIDRGTTDCDKVRQQVERMEEPARAMIRMVDQLLADAMNDAEDIELRLGHVDIVALASEVIGLHQSAADAKGQTIALLGPPRLMGVADLDRLREAIENLVSNAVKYSPIGGRIEVQLEAVEDIVISVADNGPGLSPEDFGRLFGRFQRLSAKPTGGEASTGLGLSITKHIVALHGGRLDARSAGRGKGTTFTIRLPMLETEGVRR